MPGNIPMMQQPQSQPQYLPQWCLIFSNSPCYHHNNLFKLNKWFNNRFNNQFIRRFQHNKWLNSLFSSANKHSKSSSRILCYNTSFVQTQQPMQQALFIESVITQKLWLFFFMKLHCREKHNVLSTMITNCCCFISFGTYVCESLLISSWNYWVYLFNYRKIFKNVHRPEKSFNNFFCPDLFIINFRYFKCLKVNYQRN